jgi:hypothetical protein
MTLKDKYHLAKQAHSDAESELWKADGKGASDTILAELQNKVYLALEERKKAFKAYCESTE